MSVSRRAFIGSLAGLAAATGIPASWWRFMPNYSGPVSDHFDGVRFFDPDGSSPRSVFELLRWQREGGRVQWPEWAPSPFTDTPPAKVLSGVRLSFVGHASWLIQTAGLNLLVDPVWSERASPFPFAGPKRVNDPGIAFE